VHLEASCVRKEVTRAPFNLHCLSPPPSKNKDWKKLLLFS
jgi:hypothetical protein